MFLHSGLCLLLFSLCTFFFDSIISFLSSPLVTLRYVSLRAQSSVLCSRPACPAAYQTYSLRRLMGASNAMFSDTSSFHSDLVLWIPQLQEWHPHLPSQKLRSCPRLLFTLPSCLLSCQALKHSAFLVANGGFSFLCHCPSSAFIIFTSIIAAVSKLVTLPLYAPFSPISLPRQIK